MKTLSENIRNFMGWCPQKKISYGIQDGFISDHACSSKSHADNNPIHEDMDVPLQMFDRRIWAIFGGFIVLILAISVWIGTFSYLFPSSFILIALLFTFFHTKLSVGSETLRITTPILGDIVISKNNIKSIEIFENYANRHKLRSLVLFMLFFILLIFNAVMIKNPIMNKMHIIAIFLFIYVFYASIHISKYPRMIKIHASGRDILFYPRNEHDFSILKAVKLRKEEE